MGFLPADKVGCEQLPLPVFVNGERPPVPSMAPEVGQHTDEVLSRVLGKSASELAKLHESGVLG
jgi:crotonobetainyl-CoA:carnitine CoA-transferase CaiB-like acyl-CoA transferase